MKNILPYLLCLALTLTRQPSTRFKRRMPCPPEPETGAVVCEPGVYLTQPDDCLPLGPSNYLTDLARAGITLPHCCPPPNPTRAWPSFL